MPPELQALIAWLMQYRGWAAIALVAFVAYDNRERLGKVWALGKTWLANRTSVTAPAARKDSSDTLAVIKRLACKAKQSGNTEALNAAKILWASQLEEEAS
jgi:hypothetical protein